MGHAGHSGVSIRSVVDPSLSVSARAACVECVRFPDNDISEEAE